MFHRVRRLPEVFMFYSKVGLVVPVPVVADVGVLPIMTALLGPMICTFGRLPEISTVHERGVQLVLFTRRC